jgi:hypothetical protein
MPNGQLDDSEKLFPFFQRVGVFQQYLAAQAQPLKAS